jgi:hypothetical protein
MQVSTNFSTECWQYYFESPQKLDCFPSVHCNSLMISVEENTKHSDNSVPLREVFGTGQLTLMQGLHIVHAACVLYFHMWCSLIEYCDLRSEIFVDIMDV